MTVHSLLRSSMVMAALMASIVMGCGDDSGPTTMDGSLRPDLGPDADITAPAGIEVQLSPARTYYRTEQTVGVLATVLDIDSMPMNGVDVVITAEPAGAASDLGGGNFTLLQEGALVFEACTAIGGVTGAPICDSVRILVDDGSPSLEVSAPAPGAELGGDGSAAIEVSGSVADSREVVVYVNGTPAEVDDMGMFTASIPPLFGVNHLEVAASDGVSDAARVELDVLWGDRYLPTDEGDQPAVTIDDALTLQLAQAFFDDGTALDTETMPLTTRDLAGVFELVLTNLDFVNLLPNPLIDTASLDLHVTDVESTDLTVEVDVVEGGAELFVRFGSLDASTTGVLRFDGADLDLGGGIHIEASAFARLTVTKADDASPVVAEVDTIAVAIEELDGRFVDSQANAILALAEGVFRNTLEDQLRAAFSGTLINALPQILGGALNGLDTALRDQQILLDTSFFEPVTITFDARLSGLETQHRRWLRAPMRMRLATDASIAHPESRGVVDLEATGEALFDGIPVQLAIRLAVVNGLLHTLWNSGLLEIDATNLLPASLAGAIEQATISGRMAPIVRPARGTETDDLMLSLGQMELQLRVLDDVTRFGITIESGANLNVVDGSISLDLAPTPRVGTWIIESNTATPLIDDVALKGLLETNLWPQIRDAVSGGIAFSLPNLDVGDLSSISPALAGFMLSIQMNQRLDVRENSAVLDLAIIGTLP